MIVKKRKQKTKMEEEGCSSEEKNYYSEQGEEERGNRRKRRGTETAHTHTPGELFEAVQHGDDGVWRQLLTLCLRLVLAHPHQLWTSALQETHARRDEGLLRHRNTTNSLTFQELCMLIYANKILFLLS